MRDTGIAQRLREAGLHVVECAGWQTRGADSLNARGSIDHHTAGPSKGNAPSLNICIHGRHDLPGPLCQVLIARDNTCFIVAAGRANHAGSGGWKGLNGNSQVYGIERENVGTPKEPWRSDQTEVAAKAHAALIRDKASAEMVCQHKEWTRRKIDTHTLTGNDLRAKVAHYLRGGSAHPPPTQPPAEVQQELGMFCLVQPPGAGIYRFSGQGMIGVPNPSALQGDQIQLMRLGLNSQVWEVSREWFDTWPMIRG